MIRLAVATALGAAAVGLAIAGLVLVEVATAVNYFHGELFTLYTTAPALLAVGWFHAARGAGFIRAAARVGGALIALSAALVIVGIVKQYKFSFTGGGSTGITWMQVGLTCALVGLALLHFAGPVPARAGEVAAVACTTLAVASASFGLGLGLIASRYHYFEVEGWLYFAPVWAVIAAAAYLGTTSTDATAAGP